MAAFGGSPGKEKDNMAVSKANQRAVNKYKKNNYDRIEITVPKGQRAVFQAHAAARGESVNGFIGRAISETMERDGSRTALKIAGKCPELPSGDGVVSLPSEARRTAQKSAETGSVSAPVDKAKAAEELFSILGDLGAADLDKARCERLGIVYLPPDTLETVQRAAEAAGEAVPDFMRRAVTAQAQRDQTSMKLGINPTTGGKLEREA